MCTTRGCFGRMYPEVHLEYPNMMRTRNWIFMNLTISIAILEWHVMSRTFRFWV